MFSKQHTIVRSILLAALLLAVSANFASAAFYKFLTVSGNGVPGNGAFSQFNSPFNGVITVRHNFPNGGVGADDNNNPLIFPSTFPINFPNTITNPAQGHLAQTVYSHTSDVIFNLTGYNLSPTTVFGMWNTTTQVALPAYNISLFNGSSFVPPTTFTPFGTGDENNTTQVSGQFQMKLVPSTGDIVNGIFLGGSTHTDAAFWNNIPAGTQQIVVHANLGPLNTIGDGVGYYFAELVPEPSSIVLSVLGVMSVGILALRRRR